MSERRNYWPSRFAFVMAAVGSAVGLGNLWRFPYIAYNNGGGAFLIPWLVALFTAGIPLMRLELALGTRFRAGAPKAFASLNPKYAWVGWGTLLVGFAIVSYYAVVMAWSLLYLKHSLNVAWGEDAAGFFHQRVLNLTEGVGDTGGLQWSALVALILVWVIIYLIIFKGPRIVGKVVLWTVPLPVLLILVFIIRGLTLPGSLSGLKFYLKPDFARLLDISVWREAYGQIFFSLSLAFGIMIAYAKYQPPEKTEVNRNASIISIANCSTSFIAGFAVFTVIGYLAVSTGQAIEGLKIAGPGLTFITYPTAIQLMPLAPLFGILFFAMLLSLGIDSAFSLVEALAAGFQDFVKAKKEKISFWVCLAGLIGGILFITRAGYYWLDIVDHFANGTLLVLFGLLECVFAGWLFGAKKIREFANTNSETQIGRWWYVCITVLTPLALIIILAYTVWGSLKSPYGDYPSWALWLGGWGLMLAVVITSVLFGFLIREKNPKPVTSDQ
jgi:NSS family neurotransmitter:Na+ symporter